MVTNDLNPLGPTIDLRKRQYVIMTPEQMSELSQRLAALPVPYSAMRPIMTIIESAMVTSPQPPQPPPPPDAPKE